MEMPDLASRSTGADPVDPHEARTSSQHDASTSGEEQQLKVGKKLSHKKLAKLNEAYQNRGVVYISRIPPHMKPLKVRHLLEEFGAIGRVYLAPEDPALRAKRKKNKGNTGKNFTEGWVEFEDKSVAKKVAAMFNGQPMTAEKRSAYHYDLWNIKYLPKFKWDHLTEEITYQNAVREQRMANEISSAKRERDFYMSRVDKAKAITAITERKRKRARNGEPAAAVENPAASVAAGTSGTAQPQGAPDSSPPTASAPPRVLRRYEQRKGKPDSVTDAEAPVLSPDLLSLIAGRKS